MRYRQDACLSDPGPAGIVATPGPENEYDEYDVPMKMRFPFDGAY